jgi:hypothetical protein
VRKRRKGRRGGGRARDEIRKKLDRERPRLGRCIVASVQCSLCAPLASAYMRVSSERTDLGIQLTYRSLLRTGISEHVRLREQLKRHALVLLSAEVQLNDAERLAFWRIRRFTEPPPRRQPVEQRDHRVGAPQPYA